MTMLVICAIFWKYTLAGYITFILWDIYKTYSAVSQEQKDIADYKEIYQNKQISMSRKHG